MHKALVMVVNHMNVLPAGIIGHGPGYSNGGMGADGGLDQRPVRQVIRNRSGFTRMLLRRESCRPAATATGS